MPRLAITIIAALAVAALGRTIQRSNVDATLDATGGIINAHETQIVQWETNGLYYMYAMKYALCRSGPTEGPGCSANKSECDFRPDHNVSVYTSPDLTSGSWHWEADILPGDVPLASYFRGKVLRHRAMGTYILYIFGGGRLIVAKASSPTGPFVTHSVTKSGDALKYKTGDLSFFIDDDEAAYIIYNADMGGMCIERLSDDYLMPVGRLHANASTPLFGQSGTEAPVMFKRQGLYYALFDHTCCVCSYGSGVQVWTSESPMGEYTFRGQVGRDDQGDPITHAQQCWIMHLPGADPEYMWIGDQWGSARDGLHGHDFTYWQPLRFNDDGSIQNFTWTESVDLTLPVFQPISV